MAAGLQLKNQLTSKDATVRLQYQQRWLSLDEGVKTHVKNMVRELQNCDDSSDRFHACLNVVFYVIDWVFLPVFVLQAVQTLGTEIARPAIAPQVKNKVKIQQIRDAVTGLLKAWVKFFFPSFNRLCCEKFLHCVVLVNQNLSFKVMIFKMSFLYVFTMFNFCFSY